MSAGRVLAFQQPPAGGERWAPVVESFLASLDCAGTRACYRRHLARFFQDAPADLTRAALADFRARLVADGRGPGTHALVLAVLRSFLAWARLQGELEHLPAEVVAALLRSPRAVVLRPYQVLSDRESAALLAAAGASSARDLALLATFLGSGLRCSEVSHLDVSDLLEDDDGATLWVRAGKGRKDRQVPIRAEVAAVLRSYLAAGSARRRAPGMPLFLAEGRSGNGKDRRLGNRAIGLAVDRLCAAAGIAGKRISPHSLRHSYAVAFLRAGGEVTALAKLLGHASIGTTMRYVDHLALRDLRSALPALPLPALSAPQAHEREPR